MVSDKKITKIVMSADKYSPDMRIAAWFLREGGSEEEWHQACSRLSELPEPIMNNVYVCIRDINRRKIPLESIPGLEF